MIKKGTWIEIQEVVLTPEERSSAIPEETKKTPLLVWIRGNCMKDCSLGDEVEVETLAGRILKGIVVQERPSYEHNFGEYIDEIAYIGKQARAILSSNNI